MSLKTKREEATITAKDISLPPAPLAALPDDPKQKGQAQLTSQLDVNKARTTQNNDTDSEPTTPVKKRIIIEQPYNFYRDAPHTPQSVTTIESPFGDSSPITPTGPSISTLATGTAGSTYQILPTQSNPFIPPKEFQPFQVTYQPRQLKPLNQVQPKKDRPDPEDSIPAGRSSMEAKTERSNSARHIRGFGLTNRPARSHSFGAAGKLQSRQQYEQEQLKHQQAGYARTSEEQAEAPPIRKNSGKNLLRKAREASDSAFRSVGLHRKSSAKLEALMAEALQSREAELNLAHNATSRTRVQQGQNSAHPNDEANDPYCMTKVEVDLSRNRSLPDIKPFSSNDHQTPARGSSLTNPRTNPGPFRNRQKPHNQLENLPTNHHQTATAMSNEPISAALSTSDQAPLQDAYGGTTDDWRQAQQAEEESRARQRLSEAGPADRMSINSVSTLNLPPSSPTVTPPQTMSLSRILLPDRNRSQNNQMLNSNIQATSHDQNVEEPTQESTSLAKAEAQTGGILSQLQAATEKGQVIDPVTSFWSQKEDRYIQRSNTAPYPVRETRTIIEEDEAESPVLSGQRELGGSLEYSKSEGYGAASRYNRLQKRVRIQQDQHRSDEEQQPSQQQQQRYLSRSRAMSHESVVDTAKDLPPTPLRSSPPGHVSIDPALQSRQQRQLSNIQYQNHRRLRSETHPESARQIPRPLARTTGGTGNGAITSEESVLTLSRSMSPTPIRRGSHQRTGSFGHSLARGASTANRQQPNGPDHGHGVHKERVQYGIDMLPLPVIPSPDESVKKNANPGILPQDVLKTLDPSTVQKAITASVIASRVYKVLSLYEIESLKKEQEDLQQYVQALHASLNIESRMRDASHSLIRLHENNTNIDAVKASTGQLHATTRKMDKIVQKTQESMERMLVIQRMLLQHEAAVLNAGMRRLDGENRELSRNVMELEKTRDQEKEEKLKWKKETSQLRIQSMIFPNPPGLDEYEAASAAGTDGAKGRKIPPGRKSPSGNHRQVVHESSPSPPPLQQDDARLAAMEKYMKELNEEISKKDERIGELESQLRMVQVWVDDFARSMKPSKSEGEEEGQDYERGATLQKQLVRLQTKIENGFRILEASAYEMKVKAEEAEATKNKALEFTATTLANSAVATGHPPQQQPQPQPQPQIQQPQPLVGRTRTGRSRAHLHDNNNNNNNNNNGGNQRQSFIQHSNEHSDLNMILNESLLELEHQLSLTESSSPSIGSHTSSTPDLHERRGARSPSVTRQGGDMPRGLARSRQVQQQQQQHHHHQRQQTPPPPQQQQQQQQGGGKDELALGDAHEEIKRLNTMVDELERVIRVRMNF
ncbi:hypothetical protein BGX23_004298 [Mortierella sp. AD031]|nr:hypothetical protein BGX23_004298 [Mortierella sp. AD031]